MSKKSQKWHVNNKGVVDKCRAEKGKCPFGSVSLHFNTKQEAQEFADLQNEIDGITKGTIFEGCYTILENTNLYLTNRGWVEFYRNEDRSINPNIGQLLDENHTSLNPYQEVPNGLYEKVIERDKMIDDNEDKQYPDEGYIKNVCNQLVHNKKPDFYFDDGSCRWHISKIKKGDPFWESEIYYQKEGVDYNYANNDEETLEKFFDKFYKKKNGGKSFSELKKELANNGHEAFLYHENTYYGSEFGIWVKRV